ncbi:AfsR/SARP family transcriptional regulator [Allokutzneria albata]|uniref:DNA-binding transcriptional activator of the SARP family n=1 Tax=Allokutzneria albata TaxID=211114 RepID=A0A1H0AWM8_ALLAB|nr:BTAD domain-containing putative transcriptional regulator [Allokutzneria albata]SDN37862.1 DNA-binding transcriptional activator of the SARP family [Allokutzneria albata]
MSVEFRLLGALEVLVDGRVVPVKAGKQRAVLAALLLHAGRTVGVVELLDALWGDEQPTTARNALQTHIARLRRLLGEDVIRTAGGGYVLATERIDLVRFRELVRRAKSTSRETRARLLNEALSLRRGPVLADVTSVSLHANEIKQLNAELLDVLEQRIEVDLELGRHRELVGELRALVADHPFRERFWRHLMLALYRSERQAEALMVFRDYANALNEEMGIAPSTELRALHHAILVGEVAAPRSNIVVPQQLPGDISDFVGREGLVDRISRLLDTGTQLVVVSGPPGVGKTALAVRVAHRLKHRFPDGQLHVNLHGYSANARPTPGQVLARFLRALGVPTDRVPASVDEQASMLRSELSDRRVLLVLDNAIDAEQVRPLIPDTGGCAVLVTSRGVLRELIDHERVEAVALSVLTEADSLALLAEFVGDAVPDDPEASAELARLCGNLPLALRIAGANIAQQECSVREYVDGLRGGDLLSALAVDGSAVRAAFAMSYGTLSAEARRLFRFLGLVPGPDFTAWVAASLIDSTLDTASALLDELVTANLVQSHQNGRYQFHDLLRAYAAEQVTAEERAEDIDAAVEHLLDWHLFAAGTARTLLPLRAYTNKLPERVRIGVPFNDRAGAEAWMEDERANLRAVVALASRRGRNEHLWQFVDVLWTYLLAKGHNVDCREIAERGLATAVAVDDSGAVATMHSHLAHLTWISGDPRGALVEYDKALAAADQGASSLELGNILNNCAGVHWELGDNIRAIDYLRRATRIYQEVHARHQEANTRGNLGLAYQELGRFREAAEHNEAAIRLAAQQGAWDSYANHLANLANVRYQLGDFEGARGAVQEAIERCAELGLHQAEALAHVGFGELLAFEGDGQGAMREAQKARELVSETDKWGNVAVSIVFGSAHLALDELAQARANYREAMNAAREAGFVRHEVDAAIGLARTGLRAGTVFQAIAYARAAIEQAREHGIRIREAEGLHVLGLLLRDAGEVDEARETWQLAEAMFVEMGVHTAAAVRALLDGTP